MCDRVNSLSWQLLPNHSVISEFVLDIPNPRGIIGDVVRPKFVGSSHERGFPDDGSSAARRRRVTAGHFAPCALSWDYCS
jgi:hypothetical protein